MLDWKTEDNKKNGKAGKRISWYHKNTAKNHHPHKFSMQALLKLYCMLFYYVNFFILQILFSILTLLVCLFSFSSHHLPWDQRCFWINDELSCMPLPPQKEGKRLVEGNILLTRLPLLISRQRCWLVRVASCDDHHKKMYRIKDKRNQE